jgi:hypothetical protein
MDVFFPLGYPWPTTFYLTLYLVTLLLHVVPMNYVLAGSTYWAVTACFAKPEHAAAGKNPLSQLLRDWMPFSLGIAITAGVAPLLFLQLLYKQSFYTANLLLFHRWMSILPVLILAFYLLYLRKAKGVDQWPLVARIAIALAAGACFLFVAWSWTENHLLALAQSVWAEQYASGRLVYWSREQLPRLAVWYVGAFPTLTVLLGWQVQFHLRRGTVWPETPVPRLLRIALIALIASAFAALVYFLTLDGGTRSALARNGGWFYMGLALVGWVGQLTAWFAMWRKGSLSTAGLSGASVALGVTLLGATVLRELRRLAVIDIQALFDQHAAAAAVRGLPLFLLFLALNAVVIIAAILLVKKNLHSSSTVA